MSPVPMPPMPMQPITIRLLAATLPALPNADEETIYGKATVPAVMPVAFFRNRRLFILFLSIIKRLYS